MRARFTFFWPSPIVIPVLPRLQRDEHGCRRSGIIGGKGRGSASEIFILPFFGEWNNLSLDRKPLQAVDFETLFEEYLKPFELRYEEAKAAATELWRKYSALSNRLDFLPLDSEEYMKLSDECDAKKAEYDTAHAQTDHLYNEWQQERSRYFCVYCFKPMFLDVLVERLHGIAESILSDINQMKEDKP